MKAEHPSRLVLALTLVAMVSAAVLALVDQWTRQPILLAQEKALHDALNQVLPEHANHVLDDVVSVLDAGQSYKVYRARNAAGDLLGFAWQVIAPDGYSGSIKILIGVDADLHVYAIRVIDHRETPGLGDGIVKNSSWLASFQGRSLDSGRWAVKKDSGDIDQFTGATISPRAVVKAVHGGLLLMRKHAEQVRSAVKGEE